MKKTRRRIDVNLVELDQVLDSALEAPWSEADHDKLKDTLHALATLLVRSRNTEKTSEVVEKPEGSEAEAQQDNNAPPPLGTAAMERRRLVVRGRWISSTRS